MPSVLHLKPDEVDTPEKRANYSVTLVGCGEKSLLCVLGLVDAGFKVACVDADQSVIKRLSKGHTQLCDRQAEAKLRRFMRKEQVKVTSDVKAAVSQSQIVILTVGAKIDEKKHTDCSEIESVSKQVGTALLQGTLIVYGGLAGLGFVESELKEALENTSGLKAGEDFGLAYCASLASDKFSKQQIGEDEFTIAADDKYSLNSAAIFLQTIAKKGVRKIPRTKLAELTVLFEAARRDVNDALNNEIAIFCENAGLDYVEMAKLLENEISRNYSAPTISEEINRNATYLLLDNAENFNAKLRLSTVARQVNEDMVRHAVSVVQDVLRDGGKTLRRAKVALLGAADTGGAAAAFAEMLETKGTKVTYYDPCFLGTEPPVRESSVKKTLNETVEGTDCVVIVSALDQFKRLNLKKLRALMKSPAALVDLAGVIEPEKVDAEGFVYRGLGRGSWKK